MTEVRTLRKRPVAMDYTSTSKVRYKTPPDIHVSQDSGHCCPPVHSAVRCTAPASVLLREACGSLQRASHSDRPCDQAPSWLSRFAGLPQHGLVTLDAVRLAVRGYHRNSIVGCVVKHWRHLTEFLLIVLRDGQVGMECPSQLGKNSRHSEVLRSIYN